MEKFYYRKLDVYQNAKALAVELYELLKTFPSNENFALCNQIRRASTSILFKLGKAKHPPTP